MKITNPLSLLSVLVLLSCGYPHEYRPILELMRPDASGIEIILPPGGIPEGESARALALVIQAGGQKREATGVSWESLDADILAVDQTGMITGIAPGKGRVSASLSGMSAAEEVNILRKVDYGRIRISEVFYDAEGADDGREFVELYNDNEYDADISGMGLADGDASGKSYVFPAGSVIGAKARVTVAQSREDFYLLFGAYPDYDAVPFVLNNSGEAVLLMKPGGTVVDAVYIRGGTEDFRPGESWCAGLLPAAPSGSSVHRAGPVDTDTCSDWSAGPPSPGE